MNRSGEPLGNQNSIRPVLPTKPKTIEDLGLPRSMVTDLVLRFAREHGTVSLSMLSKALRLPYLVVNALFQALRQQQLVVVTATAGNEYFFSLTSNARELAAERNESCRYAGPAPVPLDQYSEVVCGQRPAIRPTQKQLREAFADLVIPDKVVDQIGPALISGRPIFIYGPTGNGKTSIIERFPRVYSDSILVPFAVEVDNHIISVYDPLVHHAVDRTLDEDVDPRWIRCRRPYVVAAGELVLSMLDLSLDERSGVYAAPLQMKATNGLLLIDDFGRQRMSPPELFNRWILPLDRRIDFLSMQYGFTFQIPFEVVLAFATNLKPCEVADEAFLRRVPHKLYLGPVTAEVFDEIFRRLLLENGLPFDPRLAAALRALCKSPEGAPGLRACYPRDIYEILVALCHYKREPFHITRESLRVAAEMYFANSEVDLTSSPETRAKNGGADGHSAIRTVGSGPE
jgi:predicted ATPase with chaperone activity